MLFVGGGIQRQADGFVARRREEDGICKFHGANTFRRGRNQWLAVENGVHEILKHFDVLAAVIGEGELRFRCGWRSEGFG